MQLRRDDGFAVPDSFKLRSGTNRGSRVASAMLKDIIDDLKSSLVRRVQAYPKRTESIRPLEQWRGPE